MDLGWTARILSGLILSTALSPALASPQPSDGALICINAGGAELVDSRGTTFEADTAYSGGRNGFYEHEIAETVDDELFITERWGSFSYAIPLDPNAYLVTLYFAEIYFQSTVEDGGPGTRVFDILLEEQPVEEDFDILANVASQTAFSSTYAVGVEDGELNIGFSKTANEPKISALCVHPSEGDWDGDGYQDSIDVFPMDPAEWADSDGDGVGDNADAFPSDPEEWTDLDGDGVGDNSDTDRDGDGYLNSEDAFPNDPGEWLDSDGDGIGDNEDQTPLPEATAFELCINAGGPAYTAGNGVHYLADEYYSSGRTTTKSHDIAGTDDDLIYQSERWREFSYSIPVPAPGTYTVALEFAEIYYQSTTSTGGPGTRVFDVFVEEQLVAGGFDILSRVPGKTALTLEQMISVVDGSVDIGFGVVEEWPKLSAICIRNNLGDTDGDGVPDNEDAFPLDDGEWLDSDGDGVGDNADVFPGDPAEWSDLDGDGVGDNSDSDRDGDGYYNGDDAYPDDPERWEEDPVQPGSDWNYCVNVGGGELVSKAGLVYGADENFSGGNTKTVSLAIAGTEDDALYQSERWGDFQYDIPLPDSGQYVITLHLAEIYFQAESNSGGPGTRVFDIYLEGALTEENFDILSRVPSQTAFEKSYAVQSDDGLLTLSFSASSDNPKLSAVCVHQSHGDADGDTVLDGEDAFPMDATEWQDSDGDGVGDNADAFPNNPDEWLDSDGDGIGDNTDPTSGSERDFRACVNAGGPSYSTVEGIDYVSDQSYSGGRSNSHDVAIANTDDDTLYQSERWGSFSYSIPVPASGPYNVDLMFAEIYFQSDTDSGGPGSRVFDIHIDGERVLSDFDIMAEAGSETAVVQRYLTEVQDGSVDIDFGPVTNEPKISALCVYASNGDFDGDGVLDDDDAFPNNPDEWLDSDGDGVGDNEDAFPLDPTEWRDDDGDGIGNNSDPDIDGDGYLNDIDAFPYEASEWSDLDGDGIGDNADLDRDGDGYDNDADLFPDDPDNWEDINGNGIGDNHDPDMDSDGDGYTNADDPFPHDSSEWQDSDGDGYGDNSDAYPNDSSRWQYSDPFEVLFVKGTEAIDSIAKAQALIDDVDQYASVAISSDTISFSDSSEGNTSIFTEASDFPFDDHFAMVATRSVLVPEAGEYTFLIRSDDGARLSVDGEIIIDDDDTHSVANTTAVVYLEAGMRQIELLYFEATKSAVVELAAARGGQYDFNLSGIEGLSAISDRIDAVLTPPMLAAQVGGEWSEVVEWPEIPVSAAHLPDGKLLTWLGGTETNFPGKKTTASIYDPATGDFLEKDHTTHNQFCSGIAQMEDGSIFNSGGDPATKETSRFDLATMSWVTLDEMSYPRWYPTTLTMPDNRLFTGFSNGSGNTSEVYSDASEEWRVTPGASMQNLVDEQNLINGSQFGNGSTDMQWYAFMHVAPNGRVFQSGPMQTMHWFDTVGQGDVEQIGARLGGDQARMFGSAVMYDVGKILITGGNDPSQEEPSSNKAITVDLNGATPVIQEITPMHHKRTFHDSVVLPDGRVLIIGGTTVAKLFDDEGSIIQPEIWDPETGQWTLVNSLTVPRNYHSTALLMKDGRVFAGGGGACGACDANHKDAQFYSPDYFYSDEGDLAARPVVIQAPEQAKAGTMMAINTDSAIAEFNMIRLQGTTHSINTDQRFVPLEFSGSGGEYTVEVNPNPNVMIPGYYWLYAIDESGVPSEGVTIQIVRESDYLDSDGDGFVDAEDVFPEDPHEWADSDEDGVGDNADQLPNDPTEWADLDGDGVGDNADPDRDGDGYINEEDAFPDDPNEWVDSDGDGVGDNADIYPADPTIWGDGPTEWVLREPDFGTPDARHEADYIAVDEHLYLIGGRSSRAISVYNAVTNTWADHGVPRNDDFEELQLHHYQSVEVGGRVYIVGALKGGYPSETPVAEIYSFEPEAPVIWREEALIPEERRRGSAAAANYGGKIYVVGGNTRGHNDGWVPWFDVYDPVAKTWTVLPDAPHARDHHRASVVDGKLYVVAGRRSSVNLGNGLGDTEASVDVYDFATGQWSTLLNDLPTPRAGVALFKHGSELVVAAGESPTGDHTEVEALDVHTGHWRALPSLLTGRNAPGGASYDNELFVVAGRHGNTELSSQEVMGLFTRAMPADSDNDGVIDSQDAFPLDSGDYRDTDADGVGDNADSFPNDPAEWSDSDADGIGDNADPFPGDPSEWADSDGDGVGDNSDFHPDNASLYAASPLPVLNSTTLAVESVIDEDRVWVVNPDNNSVSLVVDDVRVAEMAVGEKPSSITLSEDGYRVWVSNKSDATISAIDTGNQLVVDTYDLPPGSQPHGLVRVPGSSDLLVVLEATAELARLDTGTGQIVARADLAGRPRHLAVSSDGQTIYVTNFITPPLTGEEGLDPDVSSGGGELFVVDAQTLSIMQTIHLGYRNQAVSESSGPGMPNYLNAPVLGPDGDWAYVPSKQDNILAGAARGGPGINFDQTVRAVTSRVDLMAGSENPGTRIDHDNAGVATGAVVTGDGRYLFVALETSREVAVHNLEDGYPLTRLTVGLAPQGLALSADGERLLVHNFMDRSLQSYDLAPILLDNLPQADSLSTVSLVGDESLLPDILLGKQLFYDAADDRLARDNYLSCASCHNDAGHDGRVWDLTSLGQGLRNTVDLVGKGAGHGLLHWTGNFDEVQDFEAQIRSLAQGTGLLDDVDFDPEEDPLLASREGLSADLDALAGYLNSLVGYPASPFYQDNPSAEALAGQDVYLRENCASCHSGEQRTDSDTGVVHNIGTLSGATGFNNDAPVDGIDTPTLDFLWATAPYLHNGSAHSIAEAILAHDNINVTEQEAQELERYLLEVDE